MPIELITYNNIQYPLFHTKGPASQYAIPYALQVCKGVGYDIGCMKKEWALPGSIPIDVSFNDSYSAMNLLNMSVDYCFSSHCLEHLDSWVDALNYWTSCLKSGGILFLYLPHYDQEYWRSWHNRKHKYIFTPQIIRDYMIDHNYINIFNSEKDLYYSFMIFGEKK